MSSSLYAIGRWCYRHAWRVVAAWVGVLAVLGVLALTLSGNFDDSFTIPSAPSQEALTKLRMTFPEASGLSAQAVVVLPEGESMSDPAIRRVIEDNLSLFKIDIVEGVVSPWDEHITGLVSKDAKAAIIQIRISMATPQIDDLQPLVDAAGVLQGKLPTGTQVTMGGEAFSLELPQMSIIEAIGVGIALVVLAIVLGSLVAAGMPIVTAVIGVGITMAVMMLLTRITTINSVTPILAVMLGLAVGIDYALFILSRHREQLRDPQLSAEESAARAVATAGSAVVFAGLTVVIALIGLALAAIPFLTVMGVFAALGVALAVAIALTLLPAFMGFYGERMRPKKPRRVANRQEGRLFSWWVNVVIRWPWVTVLVVIGACIALMLPAQHLHLSLPNSGQHAATASDRIAYDQVTKHFGVGFNGPLIVTVDLLSSTDPLGVMAGIKADILAMPGVDAVLIATPNQNADTGFAQVIPTTGPDDVATEDLVHGLRDKESTWLSKYGTATAVTGMTAIMIDVSERLGSALLPFGIFVVGLSLVLLTLVFRSILVPIKAALGYLLSVGVAFGATALVFNDGFMRQVVNLEKPMAVISFLPILLMGILFGLAMDYEVFLVSRIREEYVHGASAKEAIVKGFVGSGKVVAAAALIMVSVFAFFVPEGMGPIKAIAFALAIGILVDAFAVRMTLVPAVLAIMGDKAWWLPKWLDKRIPSLDIEGESLAHMLELAEWPGDGSLVHADQLTVDSVVTPLDLKVNPGGVVALVGGDERAGAIMALAGRLRTSGGRARVAGALLPEQAGKVRGSSAYLDPVTQASFASTLQRALARNPQVVFIDNADLLASDTDRVAVAELVSTARQERDLALVLGGANYGVLDGFDPDYVVTTRSDDVSYRAS